MNQKVPDWSQFIAKPTELPPESEAIIQVRVSLYSIGYGLIFSTIVHIKSAPKDDFSPRLKIGGPMMLGLIDFDRCCCL